MRRIPVNFRTKKLAIIVVIMLLLSNIHFVPITAIISKDDFEFRAFGANVSESGNPPPIWNENGSVTMESHSGKGKIASSEIGIAFLYQQVDANSNFIIHATAQVEHFGANNQVSFGLMVTNEVGENYTSSGKDTKYIAVGALDQELKAFYQNGDGDRTRLDAFSSRPPSSNEEYTLSLQKSGDMYTLRVNGESQTITEPELFEGDAFVGLFVSRDAKVTFSDIFIEQTKKVHSLEIDSSQLAKKEYLLGEDLDLEGLKVKAQYSDGSSENLSQDDYMILEFDNTSVGEKPVTINYNGMLATFYVNVVPLTVTELQVKYYPVKTDYYVGDSFDSKGLVVEANYNHGYRIVELDSSQYELLLEGEKLDDHARLLDSGRKKVLVQSLETEDVVTSFEINISDAEITGLDIRRLPAKTTYYVGEAIDLRGISVFAQYADGSEQHIYSNQLEVTGFDSETIGEKEIMISYRQVNSSFTINVKEKELQGIEITEYPQTTFYIGDTFDSDGLKISKIYDNGDKESLPETSYTIDATQYNATTTGKYPITIQPKDSNLASITYPVTVRERKEVEWKHIHFGQSTSDSKNKIEFLENDVIRLIAEDGAGKVTGDHDGVTFYYAELDASKDNFVLSADIKVNNYAKDPHDGQESFGIMARDAIGEPGDSSVFSSNIAAIGGYSGGTRNPNGTQLFVRTGILSSDGEGSQGIQHLMIKDEKPTPENTEVNYRLKLAKTNSGFVGQLNNEEEQIIFEPDILQVQDDKMYVGFYTARVATIDIQNIELQVSEAATDAPKVEPPEQPIEPDIDIVSRTETSDETYMLRMVANVRGLITIRKGGETIVSDQPMEANNLEELEIKMVENQSAHFTIFFQPDDTQNITNTNEIIEHFQVIMKNYHGEDGNIYVSPQGTVNGDGTRDKPLDLDTAIKFVKQGQKIIVQEGHYTRKKPLVIEKYNDGTEQNRKYLIADPQAMTRPVIDFDKQSEGVIHSGDYWHVKGIDFARSAGNTKGYTVGGNHNIIENVATYEHGDTGLQISRTDQSNNIEEWPSYNLVLNSISFDNRDPSENNADGFAAKLTVGEGNIFRGAVAHNNIDDGWDLYTKLGSGPIGAVLIEYSIAYNNGFLTDGTDGAGDKNGFKLGGEGIHVPHVIRNSVAFGNGAYGFTSNSNPGVIAIDNFAFNNEKGNLHWSTYTTIREDFSLERFISFHNGDDYPKDVYPTRLQAKDNFLYDSTTTNKLDENLPKQMKELLASIENIERDENGQIIWGEVWNIFNAFMSDYTDKDEVEGPSEPTDPSDLDDEPIDQESPPEDINHSNDGDNSNGSTDEDGDGNSDSAEKINDTADNSSDLARNDDDGKETSSEDNELPSTATYVYNLLLFGLIVLSFGMILLRRGRVK